MSLYGALYSGVSGLNANSIALGAISDNITNVNTVGYKANDTQFSTLVTEAKSSTVYVPGGVKANVRQLVSQTGLLQSSASPTDIALDGQGFFITRPSPTSTDVGFTRAGSFTQDSAGNLKNAAGNYLVGWPLDADGKYINDGSVKSLVPISTSGLTGTAEATSSVRVRANLNSGQAVSSDIASYDPTNVAHNLASGTFKPDVVQSIQVFDQQGGTQTVNIGYVKSATPNTWNVEIYTPDASSIAPVAGLQPGQLATGQVVFNADGSLNLSTAPATTLLSTPAGGPLSDTLKVNWTSGAGSKPIKISLGTNGKIDGITQFQARSQVISTDHDGAVFGNVLGVNVKNDGTVTAQFSNGVSRDVYKIPIATFQDPNDLVRQQGNTYSQSNLSGAYALNEPGLGGAGRVAPSSLEASTVDLASEFTKLITTQRAYSAASKIITTADEMLTELSQIKR